MKGISAIIAIVLFVIIAISLISVVYLYFGGMLTTMASKKISLLNDGGYTAVIRNDGTETIKADEITFSVNGIPVDIIDPHDIEARDSTLLKFVPPNFGDKLTGARVLVMGPSNSLSYVTDFFPISLEVTPKTMGFWHFDEGDYYNLTEDCSEQIDQGYYNHGNMGNDDDRDVQDIEDPDWVSGKYGSALDFDGINKDKVSIYDTSSLRYLNNITIEAWIKTSTLESRMTIGCRYDKYGDDHGGWIFYLHEGRITLNLTDRINPFIGDEVVGITDLRDGSWHHVLGTYDGSEIKVYVDGKLENSISYSDGFSTSFGWDPWVDYGSYIGLRCFTCTAIDGWYFDGVIDEVRIQNKSVTQGEIISSFYG